MAIVGGPITLLARFHVLSWRTRLLLLIAGRKRDSGICPRNVGRTRIRIATFLSIQG